ncbi:MAG: SAM-dependent methyltransferase [Oscillospiraceae bacterium]|nr:SAM-dependent methyltransferase [Oscillospiraceae bacterium]
MNRRLEAIAALVPDGKGLIDVGTDHGYLPASLAVSGYGGRLFASDIKEGPLMAAKRTAAEAGVSERIRFLLCDGLSLCPAEEIDTIVIAGMGGDLIVKILDEAEWCLDGRYHLILQPMTKAEVLRYWLIYNGFEIRRETLVEDAGHLYQILSARYGGQTRLNDAELFIGKRGLCQSQALYERELRALRVRFSRALSAMEGRDGGPRAGLYRELCRQLEEMETTA